MHAAACTLSNLLGLPPPEPPSFRHEAPFFLCHDPRTPPPPAAVNGIQAIRGAQEPGSPTATSHSSAA